MAQADTGSKWLIGQSPEAWVRWILNDTTIQVEAQLSTEFQYITRLSDSLLQVSKGGDTFLVLTEVQLRPDPRMPRRLRAYAALAEEKYDLLVYPIVFHLLPPGQAQMIAEVYHSELLGLVAHQDFAVVKAWELEAEVIRRGAERLRASPEGDQLETLLGLFASFVLDIETIQQLVRWDMNVLRESPWYQEILEEGLKQGLQRGREQGILQGRREDILHLLRTRFYLPAEVEVELTDRLTQIEVAAVLQTLLIAAAQTESLAAFTERLDQEAPLLSGG